MDAHREGLKDNVLTVYAKLCFLLIERQPWIQEGAWTRNARTSDVSDIEEDTVIDVDASDQVPPCLLFT